MEPTLDRDGREEEALEAREESSRELRAGVGVRQLHPSPQLAQK